MSDFGLKSLTWRMVFWILGTVGAVYLATTFYSNLLSRRMMLETAQREAESVTRAEIGEIQKVLRSVEENTQFLAAVIELLDPTEEELRTALQAFVQGDERIYGSAAAFVPSPEPFSPYYYVAPDGQVRTADLAADNYRYWEKDWYAVPAASGQAQWSEPYVDEGGGKAWMVTFSVPFFYAVSDERELRGVATADVSLQWLNEAGTRHHRRRDRIRHHPFQRRLHRLSSGRVSDGADRIRTRHGDS